MVYKLSRSKKYLGTCNCTSPSPSVEQLPHSLQPCLTLHLHTLDQINKSERPHSARHLSPLSWLYHPSISSTITKDFSSDLFMCLWGVQTSKIIVQDRWRTDSLDPWNQSCTFFFFFFSKTPIVLWWDLYSSWFYHLIFLKTMITYQIRDVRCRFESWPQIDPVPSGHNPRGAPHCQGNWKGCSIVTYSIIYGAREIRAWTSLAFFA